MGDSALTFVVAGHALIILPSVLGVVLPFPRVFYAHRALLHLSLLLRVGGDLTGWTRGQQWGGLGNAVAILLFRRGGRRRAGRTPVSGASLGPAAESRPHERGGEAHTRVGLTCATRSDQRRLARALRKFAPDLDLP
jgi:hypothetical protein